MRKNAETTCARYVHAELGGEGGVILPVDAVNLGSQNPPKTPKKVAKNAKNCLHF